MVRDSPYYSLLVGMSSFEITSALSIATGSWQCRVRVRPAGSSSAPFAVAKPFIEYRWMLSKQAAGAEFKYSLGQTMVHRKFGYRGAIVGYDPRCNMPEEWIAQMGVDNLPNGREQNFYHVLVDERDRPGQQVCYVAEENVVAQPLEGPVQHPAAAQLLEPWDAESGYAPRQVLLDRYPEDVADCWMVDAVMPDKGASED